MASNGPTGLRLACCCQMMAAIAMKNDKARKAGAQTFKSAKKTATKKATGGGGARAGVKKFDPIHIGEQNFAAMSAAGSFDWTCPHCGNVMKWERPWTPEGRGPLGFHCTASRCGKWSHRWIWCRDPGWFQIRNEDQRDGDHLPRLCDDLEWMFICECGTKHCPSTWSNETKTWIEPTVFPVNCKSCGRERTFKLVEGRWQEFDFVHREIERRAPAEVPPPKTDAEEEEDPTEDQFCCGVCFDEHSVIARRKHTHSCPRCNNRRVRVKELEYTCDKCHDVFTMPASSKPFCASCQNLKGITMTGRFEWKDAPSTEGWPMQSNELKQILFTGRTEVHNINGKQVEKFYPGLLTSYENADPYNRMKLGSEAARIGHKVLDLLIELAEKHQDYHSVRWLALNEDMGKRRVPDRHPWSIEQRLNIDKLPRAKREWNAVRDWVAKGKKGGRKTLSPLASWIDEMMLPAFRWRIRINQERDARRRPGLLISGSQTEYEARKWQKFLIECGIPQDSATAKTSAISFPFPEKFLIENDAETLAESVLIPIVKWLKTNQRAEWEKREFPKCEEKNGTVSEAKIRQEVYRFLKIDTNRKPKANLEVGY